MIQKNFNLSERANRALEDTADRMEESHTQAVKSALLLRDLLTRHAQDGGTVLLRMSGQPDTKLVIL